MMNVLFNKGVKETYFSYVILMLCNFKISIQTHCGINITFLHLVDMNLQSVTVASCSDMLYFI